MGRRVLVLGLIATAVGGLVAALRGVVSVLALVDQSKSVTDAMIGSPFYYLYELIINGALFVVFGWALDTMPKSGVPRQTQSAGPPAP